MGLVLITLVAYCRVGRLDFVNFDDPVYVYENVHVRQGLTWENVVWAFTTGHASNWHPVTWLSLMLDAQWFSVGSTAFHLVNLAFHLVNSLLLFAVLRWMTGALWRSAFVAALFAVHPLHVESVAWVAERKDVLSTFWGFAALGAYVWYTRRPGAGRFGLVFGALAVGLMAKPMLVTWPCVFLLLDYWPLGRLEFVREEEGEGRGERGEGRRAKREGRRKKRRKSTPRPTPFYVRVVHAARRQTSLWSLVLEKAPLAVLAAASCTITFIVQSRGGSVTRLDQTTLAARVGNALVAYMLYIGKMFWPVDLAVLYPYRGAPSAGSVALAAGLLLAVSAAVAWGTWHGRRYLAVGWLWYLGTLVPVIGLVQIGRHAIADRYTYVPLVGLFLMVSWGAADLASSWRYRQKGLGIAAACTLLACVALTIRQTGTWADSEKLCRHALEVTENNTVAHENLGAFLWSHGRSAEAREHWETALGLHPDNAETLANLANILVKEKRFAEASRNLKRALELNPNSDGAHNTMAAVCLAQGNIEEALRHCQEANRLKPDNPAILRNIAEIHRSQGKLPEATAMLRQLLDIEPENISARDTLAVLLAGRKQWTEAIVELHEVLRREPGDYFAMNSLAWVLATSPDASVRNGKEAVELAQRATQGSDRRTPEILDTLAAAYAEAGRFPEAVETAQQARTMAAGQGNLELAARLLGRLELYRNGKPYREGK